MPVPCVVLGGGGHAKVVIEVLRQDGRYVPQAVTEREGRSQGREVSGVMVAGDDDELPALLRSGIGHFVVGVGSSGSTAARRRLFSLGCRLGFRPATAVHSAAHVSDAETRLGVGTVIMARAVVSCDVVVGDNCVVNSGAIVEHGCCLADHVFVAPGVCLASGVEAGHGAFLGIGSTVRQGVKIGQEAVVGAGAVVLSDVAPGETVVGVPARALTAQSTKGPEYGE